MTSLRADPSMLRFKIQKGEALQQFSVETLKIGVSEGRLILLHKPVGVSFVIKVRVQAPHY
jgi:hypothetical protein